MIIDTSNALAAPGSSRGYACLSVACRSIAPRGVPPGPSGRAAGGSLAGPAGVLRPPKRRPGDVRPPVPPRRPLPPPPRGPCAVDAWGGGGEGGPGREKGGRAAPPPAKAERGKREKPARAGSPWPPTRSGFPPSGAPSRRTRLGARGSLALAGRVEGPAPCRRRASAAAGAGRRAPEGSGGEEGPGRGSASRSPRFAARPRWRPGVRPTAAPAPLPLPATPPRRTVLPARPPARLASRRVRGRKPAAPRPARPRSRPRSRGSRVPGGDPRDAAVSSAVARPPPARGRAVPCRGPVPSFRVGVGRRRRRRRVLGPVPPPPRVGDGSGRARACAVSAPPPARAPPSLPSSRSGGAAGVPSAARLSPSGLSPSPGPSPDGSGVRTGAGVGPARSFVRSVRPSAAGPPGPPRPSVVRPVPLRDATSDQTWRPAEFKHISQRRKRN